MGFGLVIQRLADIRLQVNEIESRMLLDTEGNYVLPDGVTAQADAIDPNTSKCESVTEESE